MTLEEVDAAIRSHGFVWQSRKWSYDAPLTADRARDAFNDLLAADDARVTTCADFARDVVIQLRAQAAAFRACAAALRQRDSARLPPEFPGSGGKECELLLRRATQEDMADVIRVAEAYAAAAHNSDAWGDLLTALREQRDGARVRAFERRLREQRHSHRQQGAAA
jgi:hypothetical protein